MIGWKEGHTSEGLSEAWDWLRAKKSICNYSQWAWISLPMQITSEIQKELVLVMCSRQQRCWEAVYVYMPDI